MTDHLIDVDGLRLSIRITGSASPAVVILPALGGGHPEWEGVEQLLCDTTTVVSIARHGIGGSDHLPDNEHRTAQWAAEQTRAVLQAAGIAAPYVFATGSIGAYIADRYANTWPQEVAGMVLVDPTSREPLGPRFADDYLLHDGDDDERGGGFRAQLGDWQAELRAEPNPARPGRVVVLSSAKGRWLRVDPAEWHPTPLDEVDALWQVQQRVWVERWAALHARADEAGHHVNREAPRLVAQVVRRVVEAARADAAADINDATLAAVDGHLVVGDAVKG